LRWQYIELIQINLSNPQLWSSDHDNPNIKANKKNVKTNYQLTQCWMMSFFFLKKNTQKDPSKFKLTHQTHNLSYEIKIAILKVNWNNHETQFSINPMLKDKIEKKNQLKKKTRVSPGQPTKFVIRVIGPR